MQSIAAIVSQLQKDGVSLSLNGDEVRFKGGAGGIPVVVREMLSARKDELSLFLLAREHTGLPPVPRRADVPVPSPVQEMWWNWIDSDTSLTLSLVEFLKHAEMSTIVGAVQAIVSRHESLRQHFWEANGILTVGVNAADQFEVETEALSTGLNRDDLKARIDEFCGRRLLANSRWLTRCKIFIVPSYGHVVAIVANHLVVDGRSIDLMRAELRRQLTSDVPATLDGVTYGDFSRWQKDQLERSGEPLSRYWRAWANRQKCIVSPIGKAPLRWQSGWKVRRTFTIPTVVHDAVVQTAHRHATFPFFVYLAVLSISVARWSGQQSFPIRCICDTRTRPELFSVVGLMTGADAVSVEIDPRDQFFDVLKRIEADYHAAARLRLPNIYALPPFAISPAFGPDAQEQNLGIVLNYRKAIAQSSAQPRFSGTGFWPPKEGVPRRDFWRHAVSPICLELTQLESVTTVAFLLHEALLSEYEQDALIRSFFAVLWEISEGGTQEKRASGGVVAS